MKYDTVIFDLDGTLLDTLGDLAASVNFALEKKGFPKRTLDEVRCFVGNGIGKLMERSCPAGTESKIIEKSLADFRMHYKEHCMDRTRPYDGITKMLAELKNRGIKTAVVSNKADFAVKELYEYYFDGLIMTAIGERPGVLRKPAPDPVYAALDELGSKAAGAVYVGDSDVDIMTAHNAGMPCISVSWGFKGREFLEKYGAETIIDRPDEIFSYL